MKHPQRPCFDIHRSVLLRGCPATRDRDVTASIVTLRTWCDLPDPAQGWRYVNQTDALTAISRAIDDACPGADNAALIWAVQPVPDADSVRPAAHTLKQYCSSLRLYCGLHDVYLGADQPGPLCLVAARSAYTAQPPWLWGHLVGLLLAEHLPTADTGTAPMLPQGLPGSVVTIKGKRA